MDFVLVLLVLLALGVAVFAVWRTAELERRLRDTEDWLDWTRRQAPHARPPTAERMDRAIEEAWAEDDEEDAPAGASEERPGPESEAESREEEPAAPSRGDEAPVPPPPAPVADPAPAPSVAAGKLGLEAFVGGRLLLVAGIVTVLFGVAFFLKFAFDRELIGPLGRVLMGAAFGVAALVGGDRLYRRELPNFGQGLMGLGLGALYLSIYFASVRYGLVGRQVAFVATALVTALGAALAVWRQGPFLAWIGFTAGLVAPALLGRDEDQLEWLAAWLMLMDVGLLVVLLRRRWVGIDLLSLAATAVYLTAWHDAFFVPARLGAACGVLGARVLALLALALLPPMLTGVRLGGTALATALLAGVYGVAAGHELLEATHPYTLAASVVALALLYLGAGWMVQSHPSGKRRDADLLYAAAGAGLVTVVPLLLSGRAVPTAWAGCAVVAYYATTLRKRVVFSLLGHAMCFLALCHLLFELPMHDDEFIPLLNGDFIAFVSPFAALGAGAWLLTTRTRAGAEAARGMLLVAAWFSLPLLPFEFGSFFAEHPEWDHTEWIWAASTVGFALHTLAWSRCGRNPHSVMRAIPLGPVVATTVWLLPLGGFGHSDPFTPFVNPVFIAAAVSIAAVGWVARESHGRPRRVLFALTALLVFAAVTAEIYLWGGHVDGTGAEEQAARHAAQVWVSVAWTLMATTAVAYGFLRRRKSFRWAGIAVFAATLGKVFLVDLAMLETAYRIGSFMVLGLLLVGASYVYQRFSATLDDETQDTRS